MLSFFLEEIEFLVIVDEEQSYFSGIRNLCI